MGSMGGLPSVVLGVGFRRIESIQLFDFWGDCLAGLGLIGLAARFDGRFLILIFVEQDAAILRPEVRPDSVAASRVMRRPEKVDQVAVRNSFGVVDDLHDFGVSGFPSSDLIVARVGLFATGISTDHEKVNKLNRFKKKNNDFIRRFTAGVKIVELDATDRLLIPRDLARIASIEKEVVLSAAVNIIEIWNAGLYEKAIDEAAVDFAALAEEVMGDDGDDVS